uniref:Uncharacterized protein n=1 Tax=Vibrio owensii TaxID=696485 RepID=A0A1S6KSL4_9VIBR|nr:hypothetical protein [Vibrio owensii]
MNFRHKKAVYGWEDGSFANAIWLSWKLNTFSVLKNTLHRTELCSSALCNALRASRL